MNGNQPGHLERSQILAPFLGQPDGLPEMVFRPDQVPRLVGYGPQPGTVPGLFRATPNLPIQGDGGLQAVPGVFVIPAQEVEFAQPPQVQCLSQSGTDGPVNRQALLQALLGGGVKSLELMQDAQVVQATGGPLLQAQ